MRRCVPKAPPRAERLWESRKSGNLILLFRPVVFQYWDIHATDRESPHTKYIISLVASTLRIRVMAWNKATWCRQHYWQGKCLRENAVQRLSRLYNAIRDMLSFLGFGKETIFISSHESVTCTCKALSVGPSLLKKMIAWAKTHMQFGFRGKLAASYPAQDIGHGIGMLSFTSPNWQQPSSRRPLNSGRLCSFWCSKGLLYTLYKHQEPTARANVWSGPLIMLWLFFIGAVDFNWRPPTRRSAVLASVQHYCIRHAEISTRPSSTLSSVHGWYQSSGFWSEQAWNEVSAVRH